MGGGGEGRETHSLPKTISGVISVGPLDLGLGLDGLLGGVLVLLGGVFVLLYGLFVLIMVALGARFLRSDLVA